MQLFRNNARSTLVSAITATATSLEVAGLDAAKFPAPGAGDFFDLTLQDATNIEIVRITARVGGVMTISARALEGTTANAFAAASVAGIRPTAGVTESIINHAALATGAHAASAISNVPSGNISSTNMQAVVNELQGDVDTRATSAALTAAIQALYPVGSIYINAANATNPATLLGFGTWAGFGSGRVLVGLNALDASFDLLGETGGSKDAIAVAHTHAFSATTGGQSANHTHTTDVQGAHAHTYTMKSVTGGSSAGGDPQNLGTAGYTTSTDGAHAHTTAGASVDHTHAVGGTTGSTGVAGADGNLQPYVVVHMWQRTA